MYDNILFLHPPPSFYTIQVECNECSRWVHARCEGIDKEQYDAMTLGTHPIWVSIYYIYIYIYIVYIYILYNMHKLYTYTIYMYYIHILYTYTIYIIQYAYIKNIYTLYIEYKFSNQNIFLCYTPIYIHYSY